MQAASQLSGHHLHDESYPEPEHVPKQSRLGAHVHGQIDHDLLCDRHTQFTAVRRVSEKVLRKSKICKIYLSENSDTDVLTAGFIDESVQLLGRKWTEKKP